MRGKALSLLKEFLFVLVLVGLLSFITSYFFRPTHVPARSDSLHIRTVDGKAFQPEHHKPFLVHFTLRRCPVCKAVASNVAMLSRRYDVLLVAVGYRDVSMLPEPFRSKSQRLSIALDPGGEVAARFGVDRYPSDIIYDAKGRLFYRGSGYMTTLGMLARLKAASSD